MKTSEKTLIQINNLKKEFEWVDRLYVDGNGFVKLKPKVEDEVGK